MKKITCILFAILLLTAAAAADSVAQANYELTLLEETYIGKYTGETLNGVPDGYGVFVTANPNGRGWHYIGYWKDGLMEGEGATYWEDGSLEIGTYREGRLIFGYFNYDGVRLMIYTEDESGTEHVWPDDGEKAPVQEKTP